MSGARISPEKWLLLDSLLQRGWSLAAASRKVGITRQSAYRYLNGLGDTRANIVRVNGRDRAKRGGVVSAPIPFDRLCEEARRSLTDFGFFQRRYFGRIATPWQEEAAQRVAEWLETPEKEYVVINAPPGCGKSTTFTLDIPAWVTVRNRAIRGQIGSKVATSAARYIQRLKRAFEATSPIQNESVDVGLGLALDAEATLAGDFGLFRPEHKELWSNDAIIVAQMDGRSIDEKEPTWSAFGMDSGFLGMRYDLIVWDDLVDKRTMRTAEGRESIREWWDDVAEKRLEPNGVLILQGQRMGAEDLYRYALDKRWSADDDEGEDELGEGAGALPKYQHVVYRAHYEDRCREEHSKSAAYYPEGCLLDPRRLTWRELKMEQANKRNNFQVIYQQEDLDPDTVLVDPLWVSGGKDPRTGEVFPGCVDEGRALCELPHGLFGTLLSVATADPSPTKFWSIQWWVVRIVDGQPQERYLMDLIRQRMDAPSFLDWLNSTQTYVGVMEAWQNRSLDLGLPITSWIVEVNAAQKFLLQYEHVRRWMAQHHVRIIPHTTTINKSDDEYGVQTLSNLYRYGQVRLPGAKSAWNARMKLVEEVTRWPEGKSDDCVMAQWFLEWNLPRLIPPSKPLPRNPHRPSWLRVVDTWGARREKLNA